MQFILAYYGSALLIGCLFVGIVLFLEHLS